jgi:glycosyltransferase involved in cell wall biosynthesis
MYASNKLSIVIEVEKLFAAGDPALVVFSDGSALPPVDLLEACVSGSLPFVTVTQANVEYWWPDDKLAERYRKVVPIARRCYFVSKANQRLLEKQIACELPNAEIVCNPVNVDRNASLPWPPLSVDSELRLACVARLHPASKGQDILLEALAGPAWAARNWRLTFYGDGPMKNGLQRMVQYLELQDRVIFAGWVDGVEKIWAENHALVMPSRCEGLPLAMVEAMMCARPVVATDVGGHSEILEDGVSGFLAEAPTAASIARALERLWGHRHNLRMIGETAAKTIRAHVPADPPKVFSQKLQCLFSAPSKALP